MKELLTAREAAAILECDYRTVLNYIRDKRLPAFKARGFRRGDTSPWRIKRSDLDAFMQGNGSAHAEPSNERDSKVESRGSDRAVPSHRGED